MKYLRYLGVIVVILILIITAGLAWLTTQFDPNHYKPQLTQLVADKMGRQLTIKGNMTWSFYPSLGIKAADISVANLPGFTNEPLLQIAEMHIAVKLLPLFSKRIEVQTIIINNPQLNLIKNKRGEVNWRINKTTQKTNLNEIATIPEANTTSNTLAGFGLADLQIKNANIHYIDQQQQQDIRIKQLNLQSQQAGFNKVFPLKADFRVATSQIPAAKVDLKTQIQFDATAQMLNLQNLQLNLTGDQQTLHAQTDVQLNLANQAATVSNITLQIPQWQTTSMHLTDFKLAGTATIKPSVSQVNLLQRSVVSGNITIANLTASAVKLTDIKGQLHGKAGIFQLAPISATVYQGKANGEVTVDLTKTTPAFHIQQTIANVSLQGLLQDIKSLGKLKVSGTADLAFNVTSQGQDAPTIIRQLNGNGNLAVKNGTLYGVDFAYLLNLGSALYHREAVPQKATGEAKTDFGDLTGTFAITRGVLQNNDLLMQSSWLHATGHGVADINQQMLDYHFDIAKMNQTTQRPQNDVIPIIASGPFSHVTVRPDVQALLKRVSKQEIQKQVGKLQERLGIKIKHLNLDNLLGG